MEAQNRQFRQTIFPEKKTIFQKPPKGAQKIKVFSNHFPVEIKNAFQHINEWYIKIFKWENEEGEDQKDLYTKNPSVVKNEIEADARKTISKIYGANRKKIYEKMGRVLQSGSHVFSFEKKITESCILFEEDKEFLLALEKKNEDLTLN